MDTIGQEKFIDLNIEYRHIQLFEENIEENLWDLALHEEFLDVILKARYLK